MGMHSVGLARVDMHGVGKHMYAVIMPHMSMHIHSTVCKA
jgi:hypothetical protein